GASTARGKRGGARVDRRLAVASRCVYRAVELELSDYAGDAEKARTGEFSDAGDLSDPPLQRRGDRSGHRLRFGARELRRYHDGRIIYSRQGGHRQESKR